MISRLPLLGLVLATAFATAQAQSTAVLTGTVVARDGAPVVAATVRIAGTELATRTDDAGAFRLAGIPLGAVELTVSSIGMESVARSLRIDTPDPAPIVVTLDERAAQLGNVTVIGRRSANREPATIGKVAIAPMDLPQSIAMLDRRLLDQQQVGSLGDALRSVNGVYVMGTTGGTQQELAGRGFSFGSSSTFKNGVRYNNAAMPEMSGLERVEVMKGTNAILFGNVAPGGVINLVTRKPTFEHGGEVGLRLGSYGLYRPTVDVYGALLGGSTAAYRMNMSYESAGSFREQVESERLYLNPSLRVVPTAGTDVVIEGDYMKDHRTVDYGIGAINYAIADMPRDRFIGASWSYNDVEQSSATATVTQALSSDVELRGVAGLQRYASDLFGTTRPNASGQAVRSDGMWVRGVQRSEVDERYWIGQLDLTAKLETMGLSHRLLVGADVDGYRTRTTAYEAIARYDSINVFDPAATATRNDIPSLKARTLTDNPVSRAGVYLQDLVGIGERIKLLLGARWTYIENESSVLTHATGATTTVTAYDDAITPRLGLVVQPIDDLSLFASYGTSFSTNTGVDIAGNALPPSYIDQIEVGVKTDWLGGALSTNAVVYQIDNDQLAQTSLENGNTNTNIKELAGAIRSRGVELDVTARALDGFSVTAGYSYNDTRYTSSNIFEVGSRLRYNPAHTANLSAGYDFTGALDGLSAGLGLTYIGERMAGRSTRLTVANDAYRLIPLDPFTLVDASLAYRISDVQLRLKVANVLDALGYYAHDDNSVNPIAPRTLSLTTSIDL